MELFFQFVSYQWHLFGLLCGLLVLLMFYEQRKSGPALSPQQLANLINQQQAVVIDVRAAADYKAGHIVDAVNIPVSQLDKQSQQLDKYAGRPLVVVCKMGQHSGAAAKQLKTKGFEQVYRLSGGMMEWSNSQMPLVRA